MTLAAGFTGYRLFRMTKSVKRLSRVHVSTSRQDVFDITPRRALLYLPASSQKMLDKVARIEVDTLVLELEDGVAPSAKQQAREQASAYLAALRQSPPSEHLCFDLAVRVNSIESGLIAEDFEVLSRSPTMPNTFIVPKVGSVEQVSTIADLFRASYGKDRIRHSDSRLVMLIEDPHALLNMPAIIDQAKRLHTTGDLLRLDGAIFGSDDYCARIGATRSDDGSELIYARQRFVACCKAYGLQAIDSVFINYKDLVGLRRQSEQGRAWGFDGKQCIHPAQIDTIQTAFSPNHKQVEWASQLVDEYERSAEEGKGAFTFRNSTMIDRPMLLQALNIMHLNGLIEEGKRRRNTSGV